MWLAVWLSFQFSNNNMATYANMANHFNHKRHHVVAMYTIVVMDMIRT